MTFDFAECFTRSARIVAPRLLKRGLALAFDVDPPLLEVLGDLQTAARSLHRLMLAVGDLVDAGLVSFSSSLDDGGFPTVRILGAGALAPTARARAILSNVGILERRNRGSLTVLEGVCPVAGAPISVIHDELEGLLVDVTMPFQWTGQAIPALPSAGGAAAWIRLPEHSPAGVFRRRLDRSGYATTTFNAATALADTQARLDAGEQPRIVFAHEWHPRNLRPLTQWMNLPYPPSVTRIAVVPLGNSLLEDHPPGWRVYPLPMSPRDLIKVTAGVAASYDVDSLVGVLSDPPANYRILIVDDNEINQAVMSAMAEVMGYEAIQAEDGAQAVERCLDVAPAAVLMDVNMPVMDGIEATRTIRSLQQQGAIPPFPIIGTSADATQETRERSLNAGMDAFMSKPLLIKDVAAQLRSLCVAPPSAGTW